MSNKFKSLDQNTVISSNQNISRLICNNTFKVVELLRAVQSYTGQSDAWFYEGVECEILGLNQGWQKGKVRISIEFCPDEPDLTESSEKNGEISSQPESPLDDIRRTIVD